MKDFQGVQQPVAVIFPEKNSAGCHPHRLKQCIAIVKPPVFEQPGERCFLNDVSIVIDHIKNRPKRTVSVFKNNYWNQAEPSTCFRLDTMFSQSSFPSSTSSSSAKSVTIRETSLVISST